MTTSGQINRDFGMQKVESHFPATLEMVLQELERFRTCRGRIATRRDEKFTIEDMVYQIEQCWGFKRPIPHALNGSIACQAAKRNIIARSGGYAKADRDSRHCNEVPLWQWFYGVING